MSAAAANVVVVGAGACGGLAANELAQAGFSTIVFEAGKRYDARRDLSNSERNASKIMWAGPRRAAKSGTARLSYPLLTASSQPMTVMPRPRA
jgi:choline dehydrogenase-like flavoprotein